MGETQNKNVVRGSCSCCCLSCSCGELQDEDEWVRQSCSAGFEKFAAGQWELLCQEAADATRLDKPRVPVEL